MPIRVYYEVLNQKGTPALYSDNYASRPAAGYQGRIFYSPDTAQIFYDTGTTWTLLADAGVGSGSLASVCANGNTTATGISITAGGLSTNSLTSTNLTAGSIPFIGTGGLFSQDNATFFWDNTNKRLGINTASPGAPLDIHGTGTNIQLNGTGTNNTFVQFQNAGTGKWRIGNLYNAGNNDFQIYNNSLGAAAFTINSSSSATFVGSVTTAGLIANSLQIIQGTTIITSGRTGIGALVNGLTIGLDSGFTQQLYFPTAAAYIYTYPSATGTLVNATSFTTNTLPKYSSTSGVLTASMLSDDGTSVTSAGATRSNLYLKAATNSYYSQLAFTNGSNGSYGGLSYNNSGQYMQFETNSSEWLRLLSTGELGINTTSPDYPLTIKTNASANSLKILGRTSGDTSISWNDSTNTTQYAHIDVGSTYFQIYASNSQPMQFYTGGSERVRVRADGNVAIGSSSGGYATARLSVKGADTGGTNQAIYIEDSNTNTLFWVRNDGNINTGLRAQSPYNLTTSNAANMYVGSGGDLYRSTSSLKYKTDVLDYDKGLDIIKQLRPVYYKGKNDGTKQFAGFIAEEVNELGLNEFVQYADDGTPDALNYSNMTALLTKGIQQLDDRITALENKLN